MPQRASAPRQLRMDSFVPAALAEPAIASDRAQCWCCRRERRPRDFSTSSCGRAEVHATTNVLRIRRRHAEARSHWHMSCLCQDAARLHTCCCRHLKGTSRESAANSKQTGQQKANELAERPNVLKNSCSVLPPMLGLVAWRWGRLACRCGAYADQQCSKLRAALSAPTRV